MKSNQLGVVAAGHPQTARAAEIILEAGGNAFDASLAALAAACVAEPILASLGGGGFLLAHSSKSNTLYDFFVQTPQQRRASEALDFYPIHADFGAATQEFHIGQGSIAVPGMVKGIFTIHNELCSLPLNEIFSPAIEMAKTGIELNSFQAYIFRIIAPILNATSEAHQLFADPNVPDKLVSKGDVLRLTELADTLLLLCDEGEALFYRGDIAKQIAKDCAERGTLSLADLQHYQVIKRKPLEIQYRQRRILTNPGPSTGGTLIHFALQLLESLKSDVSPLAMARAMEMTNLWRQQGGLESAASSNEMTDYFKRLYQKHPLAQRGTTHISVADKQGNLASLTLSNGEGSGYVVPGTGIMLNNMLGEEDLNQGGFHNWPLNQRLSSMMSPCLVLQEKGLSYALGSGGSNRIRTAMLQVISHLLDHNLSITEAIESPRMHFEDGLLNVEPTFPEAEVSELTRYFPNVKHWPEKNLFFGGVHGVVRDASDNSLHGAGDRRRGGVSVVVTS